MLTTMLCSLGFVLFVKLLRDDAEKFTRDLNNNSEGVERLEHLANVIHKDKKRQKSLSSRLKFVGCWVLMLIPILLDILGYEIFSVTG